MTALSPAARAVLRWKAKKGYGGQCKGNSNENRNREVVWFSPQCVAPALEPVQSAMFAEVLP